jgi:hypothetical protein
MSLRTVRYLSCDYCDRRWVRVECPEPGETILPAGWLAVPLAGGKVQHRCPDCREPATLDPKISAAKFIYQPGLLAPYKVPLGPTNAG